jgi:hypothetical protein
VLVEHLDRGAVPVGVNAAEHRFGGFAILLGGSTFRHRQLEADRKVQILRIPGGDAQPAPFTFEDLEPRCRGAQLGTMADDGVVHRLGHVGCDERRRVLGVGSQPQHQRVEDPLDGAPQRPAVIAAEHLHAGADRAPRPVDDRTARLGDGQCRRRWGSGAHLDSIGAEFAGEQPESWVR